MNAATEAFHASLAGACGFGVRDEADRVIRFIEATRDSMIERDVSPHTAFVAAYQTAQTHSACGAHAWKLVNQHFNATSPVVQRMTGPEIAAHFGRVFGYAKQTEAEQAELRG